SVSAELLLGMYDISLDQFTNHEWPSTFYPFHRPWIQIRPAAFGRTRGRHYEDSWNESPIAQKARIYPVINWFGWNKFYGYPERRTMAASDAVLAESPLENAEKTKMDNLESETVESDTRASPIRDDLEETLFFFPDVHTDSTGSLTFSFVMNDAVTTWRFMAFAHTSDLSVGYKELKTISQKPLMILPNAPRFLRRSDTMQIMGRMVNLSANAIVGVASLDFLNPIDESTITQELLLSEYKQDIALAAGEIQEVTWQIHVPKHLIMPVSYAMKVESEGYSDGESSLLPVLQDRILLSESAAFQTDANSKEIYVLDKLKDLMKEETQIVDCSIESVSSPIWHAVLSLPYLLEYPFECTEQIFSRYYANAMASHLLQEYPAIGAAIRSWKETDALQSPLYKNQEVKSAILTETPWVQDALADSEQRARLAHLLEKNQVDRGLYQAITKLDQLQLPNGGFSWFAGGRDHWFITQHLMEGFAQLQFLSLIDRSTEPFRSMIGKAIDYLDQQAVSFYNEIEREVVTGRALFEDNHLNSLLIHYLYTRSLWEEDYPLDMDAKIPAFFNDQAAKYWNQYPLYSQAQLAFVFYRQANTKLADVLLRSFRERVAIKEDFAFWPESYSHAWDRLPMETHIVLLRLFSTHTNDQQLVDALKSYLIRQKRVNRWTSTKSTTAAVYALVTTGTPWIDVSRSVDIHIGTQKVSPSTGLEWGSLYWKESIRDIVTADKSAEITVTNPNSSPAWIGAYWNYFQELDEVGEYGSSSLRITKDIYRSDVSDEGERLVVVDKLRPHIGDKLIVQLTIEAQEGMEFVHLKDQRASCLEPLETISRYEWKHGLGYYRSYDDASVNFFFDYLPKGKHVFQYPLRVLQSGTFAGGISTIQSMYAPEFSAHSSGSRLIIAK
ncbi:MAG: hypothetical protein OEQ53_15350, partial [Saprospiraceae bacterium]|nr:hypothetical protein [Saprospiraceae bacterium]